MNNSTKAMLAIVAGTLAGTLVAIELEHQQRGARAQVNPSTYTYVAAEAAPAWTSEQIFDTIFRTSRKLVYLKEYTSMGGYFNGLMEADLMETAGEGEILSLTDPEGRRALVVVGKPENGNVVIFDRYDTPPTPLHYQMSLAQAKKSGMLMLSGVVSDAQMLRRILPPDLAG